MNTSIWAFASLRGSKDILFTFNFYAHKNRIEFPNEHLRNFLCNYASCSNCGKPIDFDLTNCSCKKFGILEFEYSIAHEHYTELAKLIKKQKIDICNEDYKKRQKSAKGKFNPHCIKEIFKLQNGKCYYCAESFPLAVKNQFHIEHSTPLSKGGTNWPINITLTCFRCNAMKGSLDKYSFWKKLEKKNGVHWVKERQLLVENHKRYKINMRRNIV